MKPIEPSRIDRILVRGTNWVGDAVMCVPALKEIRRIFKRARISLLVRPWVRDVYSAVDFVDEILELDRKGAHRGWRGIRRISQEIRSRDFQAAILLQNAFEAAMLAWMSGIPQRIGYARDGRGLLLTHGCRVLPEIGEAHQTYYYLEILSQAGLLPPRLWDTPDYRPSIAVGVGRADVDAANRLLEASGIPGGRRLIGINPGAAFGSAKRWLSERYAKVADALSESQQAFVVLVGSKGEQQIANDIIGQMRSPAVNLAGKTRLGELMGVLRACTLLVTNDSGPMHLAAGLGVPLVAIFGSTSERLTGPLGNRAVVVREPVECSPCFLRECPIDFRCMTRISVERVVEAAEGLLAGNSVARD